MVAGSLQQVTPEVLLRRDLKPPASLIKQFTHMRNMLAGQSSGATLDQTLLSQVIEILVLKVYDEQASSGQDIVRVQVFPGETAEDLWRRLNALFFEVKRSPGLSELSRSGDQLGIPPDMLINCVGQIQGYELTGARRDVLGEAFEAFLGPSLRGEDGQFFTPRNVVDLAVSMLNPRPHEIVLDPACGTGGFLTRALGPTPVGSECTVYGIDKDRFLARVAGIQIALLRKRPKSRAFCGNSLASPECWGREVLHFVKPGQIDVIMTNPPFGRRISVDQSIVRQYDLGRLWKRTEGGTWAKTQVVAPNRPPQVLFIERCLSLLRPGGRMAIVLPDGILGNEREGYVRQYLKHAADVVAIVDLPPETFLPGTSTKTSLLVLRKKCLGSVQPSVFMAMAKTCGHDRRGNPRFRPDGNPDDDLPAVAREFRLWSVNNAPDFTPAD